jgi:prolyl-tRNA synthetase
LAPTHEEEITALVAKEVSSWKQLPVRLYQIGASRPVLLVPSSRRTGRKFRDEARPRGGLLRGREFIMKDLYTFDATKSSALETYWLVNEAYERIFTRLGVPYVVVSRGRVALIEF